MTDSLAALPGVAIEADDMERVIRTKGVSTCLTGREHIQRVKRVIAERWPTLSEWRGRMAGRTALVLGSGPSLKRCIDGVRDRTDLDRLDTFAINASYDWVYEQGIQPTYGVIVDAGAHTVDYQTPRTGSGFLYCSQVHPDTFAKVASFPTWIFHSEVIASQFKRAPKREDVIQNLCGHRMRRDGYQSVMIYGGPTTPALMLPILHLAGYERVEFMGVDGHTERVGDTFAFHAFQKRRVDLQGGRDISITAPDGERREWLATLPMARQVLMWDGLIETWRGHMARGETSIRSIVAHGDGPIPFMMAKRGMAA